MNEDKLLKLDLLYLQAQTESLVDFTESVTGELDIERALDSKAACWKVPKTPLTPHKKKIIISDWATQYALFDGFPEFNIWAYLLAQGFELYAWTGELTPIKTAAELLPTLQKVVPIHSNDLHLKLAEKDMTKEATYIADFGQARQLADSLDELFESKFNREFPPNYLSLDKLLSLPKEQVISLLKSLNNKPPINVRIENCYVSQVGMDTITYLKKQVLDTIGKEGVEEHIILLQHFLLSLTSLTMPCNAILDHPKMNKIRAITLEGKLNSEAVARLPDHFPHLENLDVYKLEDVYDNLPVLETNIPFKKLRILKSSGALSLIVPALSEATSHLEEFSNKDCYAQPDNLALTTELRVLALKSTSVTDEEFVKIWNKSPKLHSLTLQHLLLFKGNNLQDLVKRDLRYLDLNVRYGLEETQYDFSSLWKSCGHLTSLKVVEMAWLESIIAENGSLQDLRTLSVEQAIDAKQLLFIMQHCPHLECLELSNLPQLNEEDMAHLSLTKLEKLNIRPSYSKKKIQDISIFLRACPQLKSLLVGDRDALYGLDPNSEFKSINQLTLPSCQTYQQLFTFLKVTPKVNNLLLEHAYFKDTEANNAIEFPKDLVLPDLKILTLKTSSLKAEVIYPLLNASPNLVSLKVENGLPDGVVQPLKLNSLSYLEILVTDCEPKTTTDLLKACPVLETLVLFSRKNYNLSALHSVPLPKLKTLVITKDGDKGLSFQRDLLKIIKACPNLTTIHFKDPVNINDALMKLLLARIPGHINVVFDSNTEKKEKSLIKRLFSNMGVSFRLDKPSRTKDTLHATQVFHEKIPKFPPVSRYRGNVFTGISLSSEKVELTAASEDKSTIVDLQPTDLKAIHKLFKSTWLNPKIQLGEAEIPENYAGWVRLTGLSPNDVLEQISVNPAQEIEIEFRENSRCYFVRAKNPSAVQLNISYLLKSGDIPFSMPKAQWTSIFQSHPLKSLKIEVVDGEFKLIANEEFLKLSQNQKIAELIRYFSDFTDEELSASPKDDMELINAILKEKKGVCRHRTLAFMAVAKLLGIESAAIVNDVHAFVEFYDAEEKLWKTADLGGGSVKLVVEKLPPLKGEEGDNKAAVQAKPVNKKPDKKSKDKKKVFSADNNELVTWNTRPSKAKNMGKYVQDLIEYSSELKPGSHNVLSIVNKDRIEAFYSSVTGVAKVLNKRCFILNDLDEVAHSKIVIDNQNGKYNRVDSPLKSFLQEAKEGDVLVVNWSDYKASHVGHNSMVDANRLLNGLPIPEGVTVIALLDTHQTVGEDFYSRFSVVSTCPDFTVSSAIPQSVSVLSEDEQSLSCISFDSEDWKSNMLGRFDIKNGKYQFIEGDFVKAIKNKETSLVLKNAPWHLPEFRLFVIKAIQSGKLGVNGEEVTLPPAFKIINLSQPPALKAGSYSIATFSEDSTPDDYFVLNSYTFNSLFKRYQFNEKKAVNIADGLLKQEANQALTLLVTEKLSDMQWDKILQTAESNNVTLHIKTSPSIKLPVKMKGSIEAPAVSGTAKKAISRVVITNDVDYVAEEEAHDFEISVNAQTTYSHLIERVDIESKNEEKTFQHQHSRLATLLLEGKSIVLKGQMSSALTKQLQSVFSPRPYLMINGEKRFLPETARLTFISDKPSTFELIKAESIQVSEQAIWDKLFSNKQQEEQVKKLQGICKAFYKNDNVPHFSYVTLKEMLQRMEDMPDKNPLYSFLRLRADYQRLHPLAKEAWRSVHKGEKSAGPVDINVRRMKKVTDELKKSAYVFIVGQSGIGKSRFVQKALKAEGWKIHEGLDNLASVIDPPPLTKTIIFIDEANLSPEEKFAFLEGLSDRPPGFMLKEKFVVLPDNVKFVLSGNFGHFQGRKQQAFFSRHGHIVTFKELPEQYLREEILRKTLAEIKMDNANVEDLLLETYLYINKQFLASSPLTPRNLTNMAMRTAGHRNTFPTLTQAACLAVYDEVAQLLSVEQRHALAAHLEKTYKTPAIKLSKQQLKNKVDLGNSPFKLINRRKNIVRLLDVVVEQRAMKIENKALATMGTSGILLEGDPGLGKSMLAMALLEARGFKKGVDPRKDTSADKIFYSINTSDLDEVKEKLIAAFHLGAVVIIDEINTLPIEPLLNALLSGVDLEGNPAKTPGFTLICTQNPITFDKRQALSTALLNRLQKYTVKPYEREGLIAITNNEALVDRYLAALDYATTQHLNPKPTPRDLFRKNAEMMTKEKVANAPNADDSQEPNLSSAAANQKAAGYTMPEVHVGNEDELIKKLRAAIDKYHAHLEKAKLKPAGKTEKGLQDIALKNQAILELHTILHTKQSAAETKGQLEAWRAKTDPDSWGNTLSKRRGGNIFWRCIDAIKVFFNAPKTTTGVTGVKVVALVKQGLFKEHSNTTEPDQPDPNQDHSNKI